MGSKYFIGLFYTSRMLSRLNSNYFINKTINSNVELDRLKTKLIKNANLIFQFNTTSHFKFLSTSLKFLIGINNIYDYHISKNIITNVNNPDTELSVGPNSKYDFQIRKIENYLHLNKEDFITKIFSNETSYKNSKLEVKNLENIYEIPLVQRSANFRANLYRPIFNPSQIIVPKKDFSVFNNAIIFKNKIDLNKYFLMYILQI